MKVTLRPLDALTPYAGNPKAHPPEQIQKIAASIREFGFLVPLVVDRQGLIIAGHGRYEAARLLGTEKVPCIDAGRLSPEQVRAFRIADNKVAECDWIEEVLLEELKSLSASGYDITLTGFTVEDITGDGDELERKILDEKEHAPTPDREDLAEQINERLQEIAAADPGRFDAANAIVLPLKRGSRKCFVLVDPATADAIRELERYAAAGETSPLECLFRSIFSMKTPEAEP
jgi:ParB-like chromosome segregation protein Spo0J